MNGKVLLTVVCAVLLAGCDRDIVPLPFDRKGPSAEVRQAAEAAREQEAERVRLTGERQSFRLFLTTTGAVVANEIDTLSRADGRIAADRKSLSARIKEAARRGERSGEDVRGEALLALLDDDAVNELAIRYLGHDFRLERLALAEGMAGVVAENRRQTAALAANQEAYDSQRKNVEAERERARASTLQAAERIKADIDGYEKRREDVRRKLQFVSATERKSLNSELSSIDSQLRQLRLSYDSMRANRSVQDDSARAGRDAEWSLESANRRKIAEDERIRRRFSGRKTAAELASACEESTVRALQGAMDARAKEIGQSLSGVRRTQVCIQATAAGVDGLGLEALKRARAEIEGQMSRISEAK